MGAKVLFIFTPVRKVDRHELCGTITWYNDSNWQICTQYIAILPGKLVVLAQGWNICHEANNYQNGFLARVTEVTVYGDYYNYPLR